MAGREHMIRNEISVLKSISQGHKNIVTLWVYLVTDLCQGGELFDRICALQYFKEQDAAKLVQTVLSAVEYLHSHGIVHRDGERADGTAAGVQTDIKPENLLYRSKDADSDLLLADFGLSKVMDEQQFSALTTTCGTPAMGVVTYFLLCGYTPFGPPPSDLFSSTPADHGEHLADRDNQVDEIQAICSADYSFEPEEYWQGVSETARDFINRCLVIDQTQRMTAAEALAHPWLVSAAQPAAVTPAYNPPDLLPALRRNFDARGTFRRAIFAVRAAAALKDGGEKGAERRASLMSGLGGVGLGLGREEQREVRESAERAKREAEEEANGVEHVLAQP
ncbi:SPOSA6832_02504 [Sporobolomyces salmonicolor]|uniref:SPOSA6832_02504-mRNA-1:cds n=1 Tax=Sporidiobolus salmonicolor TaxID=5005 RepID=A0A0D6ELR3_SPOSA|nr:SPOSA6832_02504 [Sporobolomyces salmonicolor]